MEMKVALIVALGIVIAAFVHGGVYTGLRTSQEAAVLYRVNKFTGDVAFCRADVCEHPPWSRESN